VIEGIPAGLPLDAAMLGEDLSRRKMGYGRGGRMRIETDEVRFLTGVRRGMTIGSPITVILENKDFAHWEEDMAVSPRSGEPGRQVLIPRPGHADYAGGIKYGQKDLRNILERASARETAMRVALGGVARQYLRQLDIDVTSFVLEIGSVSMKSPHFETPDFSKLRSLVMASEVFCPEVVASLAMIEAIRTAKREGDTLGGIFEVRTTPLPVGLGTYTQWDRRLDGLLAQAMMSIQAIKAVEIGLGMEGARRHGSKVHDAFLPSVAGSPPVRPTNGAGGLEGGMTNGQPLLIRAAMKPISTLYNPLPSVNILTGESAPATIERSDTCAVPAASVVGEAMVCLILAQAISEKYSGDTIGELKAHMEASRQVEKHYYPGSTV
jgi:chorismate synthase